MNGSGKEREAEMTNKRRHLFQTQKVFPVSSSTLVWGPSDCFPEELAGVRFGYLHPRVS